MLDLYRSINLLRYLFIWRVNRSLAWLPRCFSTELSRALGTQIARRLPTQTARAWEKALAPWDDYRQAERKRAGRKRPSPVPEVSWPVEAALFVYPGKMAYGEGELIVWELKLLGVHAEHEFFLEVILPAVEEVSRAVGVAGGHGKNQLWGRFDVEAVYAARGRRWEPFVQAGRLDLQYRAHAQQWVEGLELNGNRESAGSQLTWITPFDLTETPPLPEVLAAARKGQKARRSSRAPSLTDILAALLARIGCALPGKHNTPEDVLAVMSAADQAAFRQALEQAARIHVRSKELARAPKYWPGRWIGEQTFSSMPPALLPALELAAILHVGKQTHFGCGTFRVT